MIKFSEKYLSWSAVFSKFVYNAFLPLTTGAENLYYIILKIVSKDSLETSAVLFVFWLEFDISVMSVQEIHQNSKNQCLQVEMTLMLL